MKRSTRQRMEADVRAGVLTRGYPKQLPDGRWALMGYKKGDRKSKFIGLGRQVSCTRVRPNAPGGWISNERCSYQFKIRGKWYACRGLGEGMATSCRRMKQAPRGIGNEARFGGAGRRR